MTDMADYGSSAGAGPSQPQKRRRTHKQRFSRSRTGCLTCRGRRIRCDETHPTCERCLELELSCVWPPNTSSAKPSRHTSPNTLSQPTLYDPAGSGSQAANPNPHSGSTSTWADQSTAALTSLYDFTNTDLSIPWDVNLGDLLPVIENGSGNGAAIEPYYGTPAGATGNMGLGWSPTDGLQNGTYPQPIPAPTSTPFDPLAPIPETSVVLNSPNQTLPWRNTNALPTFPPYNPYPFPISITIPSTINDPIEHIFPSADSKMIFQHVRSKTSTTITALTTQSQSPNQNPFMDMALRTIMVDPTSHAQTAFRHAMLSLGAAHVCHQYAKASPVQAQKMRVRTVKSNRKAMGFLGIGTSQAEQTDLVLATCLTLCVRNTLYADPAWQENMTFALRHISRRGGPTALLSEPTQGCDRRFILEQLAVADLFSTFTNGNEPSLLGDSATWWTETGTSSSDYERYLGISVEMTEMVAKYRIIHSRMTRLREKGGPADAMSKAASEGIVESAKTLLDTLDKWSSNQSTIPRIKRIQNGDNAYRHMVEISLLTEILSSDKSDQKVQNAVRSTLELCSQMSQEPISLLWPLLTAGAACIGDEHRAWVRQLIDVFRPFYCQDLEVAESILMEQWTRMDCGAGFTTWSELMRDMGKAVCLK